MKQKSNKIKLSNNYRFYCIYFKKADIMKKPFITYTKSESRKLTFYKMNENRQHVSSLVESSDLINIEIRYNSPADRAVLRLAQLYTYSSTRDVILGAKS